MEDYEKCADLNRWDDNTKCQKIFGFLSGVANDYFKRDIQGHAAADDWGLLKASLFAAFRPMDYDIQVRQALWDRVQKPMEPVISYIIDVKKMALKVNENIDFEDLKFHVLRGIDHRIKQCLKRRDLPDMETLADEAKKIESSLDDEVPTTSLRTTELPVQQALVSLTENLQKMIACLETESSDSSASSSPDLRRQDRTVRCFYCHLTGHVKSQCHKRQYDEREAVLQHSLSGSSDSDSDTDDHRVRHEHRRGDGDEAHYDRYDRRSQTSEWYETREDRSREDEDRSYRRRDLDDSRRHSSPTGSWSQNMTLFGPERRTNEHPQVDVLVGTQQMRALIDTGATSCFISADAFRSLPSPMQTLSACDESVTTADGRTMRGIIGKTNIRIRLSLNGTEKQLETLALVSTTIPYSVVLGIRFLCQADIIVHASRKSVFFADEMNLTALPPSCSDEEMKSGGKGQELMDGIRDDADFKPDRKNGIGKNQQQTGPVDGHCGRTEQQDVQAFVAEKHAIVEQRRQDYSDQRPESCKQIDYARTEGKSRILKLRHGMLRNLQISESTLDRTPESNGPTDGSRRQSTRGTILI